MPDPTEPSAWLENEAGEAIPLGTSFSIGRSTACDLPLQDSKVSRKHAVIHRQPGGAYWLSDLGSANGTYVNGERLSAPRVLRSGDRITLGHNGPAFVFVCEGVPVPTRKPADADAVSLTQLLPITSTGAELVQKAFLVPGILTVLFVIALFNTIGNPTLFNLLLAFYLAGMSYLFVYNLCGKHKPWWVLVGAGLLTCAILASPLMEIFFVFFRQVLPGDADTMVAQLQKGAPIGFAQQFVTFFFGAGLLEEFVKALPVLGALVLGLRLSEPWKSRLGVLEPLDGILIGAACGVGFTLFETLTQYVPNLVQQISQTADQSVAQMTGLQLLIPRIIGNVSGHMAYSGYLGYFVGLAALKHSALNRAIAIGVGYLSAAIIHALWDSAGVLGDPFLALVGVAAFAFLMAAILKARKLSPTRNRNFATQMHFETD